MKDDQILLAFILMLICIFMMTHGALAVVSEPDNIFYGRVSLNDQVLSSGSVSIKVNGVLIASGSIGASPDATDYYVLRVPIDAFRPKRQGAALPGDEASVYINDMNQPLKTIIIGQRGIIRKMDLGFEDSDGDGLSEGVELVLGTDPSNPDSDGDGISDGAEYYGTGSDPSGVPEVCDGIDNDLDGQIDEEGAEGCSIYFKDADEDGYGVDQDTRCLCEPTGVYTAVQPGDLDDEDPRIPDLLIFKAGITATGQGEAHGLADANNVSTVYIGLDGEASTVIASEPPENWTVYVRVSGNLSEDVRWIGSYREEWILDVDISEYADPSLDGYYPVLSWDPNEFCSPEVTGTFQLYSVDEGGKLILLIDDMYQANLYQTRGEEAVCISSVGCWQTYVIIWSRDAYIKINLPKGLSMISLPVIPESRVASDLFPEAELMFRFEKNLGYVPVADYEELEAGEGYWIVLPRERSYTLIGDAIMEYAFPAEDGWFMIGACTSSARASLDSGNIEVIYAFDPRVGYRPLLESDHLEPGQGYWIRLCNITDYTEIRVGSDVSPSEEMGSGSTPGIWRLPITATGQDVSDVLTGAHNVTTVYIGMDEAPFTSESVLPPPRWTVNMQLKDVFQSRFYSQDIRLIGNEAETWILKVEMDEDNTNPEWPGYYPVLSWDASQIPGNINKKQVKMKLTRAKTGEVLVNDMSKFRSYQTREKDGESILWYTIALELRPWEAPKERKGIPFWFGGYIPTWTWTSPQSPLSSPGLSQYYGSTGISGGTPSNVAGYPQQPWSSLNVNPYADFTGRSYSSSNGYKVYHQQAPLSSFNPKAYSGSLSSPGNFANWNTGYSQQSLPSSPYNSYSGTGSNYKSTSPNYEGYLPQKSPLFDYDKYKGSVGNYSNPLQNYKGNLKTPVPSFNYKQYPSFGNK